MTLQVEGPGFMDTAKSTASDLLSLWGQYEATKLNTRFLELQNQNQAIDAVLKTQNSQAGAAAATDQTFSAWMKANPMLAAGLGVAALALLWVAVR